MTADPKWRQIAQTLTAALGALAPGAKLPTEAALAAAHGVNRHTVRRAVEHMVQAGLVRVEQGRGCFVAEDRLDYTVQPRTRFNEWIRQQNREPEGEVLQLCTQPASAPVAAGLRIAPGASVVMLHRLGRANGVPVSLARHYFAAPGMLGALRDAPTISAALTQIGIHDYQRRQTRATARMPAVVEARVLAMPRTLPVLVCENLNVDGSGVPVEFGVGLYPSNRVQILFEP